MKHILNQQLDRERRFALYARVSTEEQTRGNYPSCESQVEELEAACRARGWLVQSIIKDEGFSAGSLNRPGLHTLRALVESGEIDGIVCTWYDRLTRSRGFYVLDEEFKRNGVDFVTLHDPADRNTASGRFMESMLVAAKTYDREQTSEKVRDKMRMRAAKGMWNGGAIPYGFQSTGDRKTIEPAPDQIRIVEQMFRVYVETRSDFLVRDWLKAHQILTRRGKAVWQVSAIRKILTNRRYIGEVEFNRENKGVPGLPEALAYGVGKADYEPLVPVELFEQAQAIRQEKSEESPNRVGRPRSYSVSRCGRVNILQGTLLCGACGHAMAPHYTYKKAGEKRRTEKFIHYYTCAQQIKRTKGLGHANPVRAEACEGWILDTTDELLSSPSIIDCAVERLHHDLDRRIQPHQEALLLTKEALQTNQEQIDKLLATIQSSQITGALLTVLNEKAEMLLKERQSLQVESKRLAQMATRPSVEFDTAAFCERLAHFRQLADKATPEELQRLIRLVVKRIDWMPDGLHRVQYYCLPKTKSCEQLFATNVHFGSP